MPNLDLWINQQNNNNEDTNATKTISNFENCLLSIRDQYHKNRLNSDHSPISNERYEKIIEILDYTLEKYKETVTNENNIQQQQQENEYEEEEKELLIIINNIFNELDKKRKIAINKNDDKDLLRDQIESNRLKETTLDYILYIILEFAGKLI
jgi:hypothetical protein